MGVGCVALYRGYCERLAEHLPGFESLSDLARLGLARTRLPQILYGENPFSGSEHAILGAPKKQPTIQASPESEHLLDALLRKEWRQRPTADQILQHPWLREGGENGAAA